ncbi:hypothetical protein [Streptomyces mirabilis]
MITLPGRRRILPGVLQRTGKSRATRRLVSQFNQLGYQVRLQPVEAA